MRFVWSSQWYPIAHIKDLSRERPSPHKLLNEALVVWYDKGVWSVAVDVCPHRGARLSKGIQVEGALTCNYHGWKFDRNGFVTDDPQTYSLRRCRSLKTRFVHVCPRGLMWVWANNSSVPISMPPPLAQHMTEKQRVTDWTSLFIPAPFFAVVENNVDAAHAHHTHHGIIGLNRAHARPFDRIVDGERIRDTWTTWLITTGVQGRHVYRFDAPNRVRLRFGQWISIEAFVTPVSKDETLLTSAAFTSVRPIAAIAKVMRNIPHVNAVMHRMGVNVARQDVEMMPEHITHWTPTEYDASILRIRQFMRRHGAPIPQLSTSRVLKPWHAHGQHCPTCRAFVRDVRTARVVWIAIAAATAGTPLSVACIAIAFSLRRLEVWMED